MRTPVWVLLGLVGLQGCAAQLRAYYRELGVKKGASQSEIKRAYHEQAKKYHPDKNEKEESAGRKFQRVAEAYETLSDPEKRRLYDAYGEDYKNVQQQQQQRQQQRDFFDPFNQYRNRRPQVAQSVPFTSVRVAWWCPMLR